MGKRISPQQYELALLEKLRLDFGMAAVQVYGTENGQQHRIIGRHSGVERQLDVAVYRAGELRPFLIADAKRHASKLDVKAVEEFIGMVDDVGSEIGILVAPEGFTKAARQRVSVTSTRLWLMTIEQAMTYQWLPVAREIYPYDMAFHEKLALAVRYVNESGNADPVIDALEGIAFEEWNSFVGYALLQHQEEAVSILQTIVSYHPESGWRFNALRHLLDSKSLNQGLAESVLEQETDPDVLALLDLP